MCHVPEGPDGYRRLIRVHTSLDLEAAEIHQIGLDEIARIDGELAELAGRTLGASSLKDALAHLRGDPALYFASRDEFFDTAAACLARAEAAVPDWFGRLPQATCEVIRMGPHEEEHSTVAYYRQPAIDGSRAGQYFLNTAEPETRPRYELEALTYHESIPGHHLQIAIGQELPHLPQFRRHLGTDRVLRGLGPVHRAPERRDGPLQRRPRPDRRPVVRRLAGRAARRRHRHPRDGLVSRPGDRVHARAHGPRAEQHRQRGRSLHRAARPGARLQARPARDPQAPRRGPGAVSATGSTSAASTTRSWAAARSPCRRCAAWSRPGPRGGSPRADGRHRGRRSGRAARDRRAVPRWGSCATATSGRSSWRGRSAWPPTGPCSSSPCWSPTTRAGPCWSGSCRSPGCSRRPRSTSSSTRAASGDPNARWWGSTSCGRPARSSWRPPASPTRPCSCSRPSQSRRRPAPWCGRPSSRSCPQVATSPAELVSANTAGALGESAGHVRRAARRGPGGRPARGGAGGAGLGRAVRARRRGRARDPRPRGVAPVPPGAGAAARDPGRRRRPGAGRAGRRPGWS